VSGMNVRPNVSLGWKADIRGYEGQPERQTINRHFRLGGRTDVALGVQVKCDCTPDQPSVA